MNRTSIRSLLESSSPLPPESLAESFFHKLSQPIGAMYASLELGLMSEDSKQLKAAMEASLAQLERLRWLFQAAREFFATDFCAKARNISLRECVEAAMNDSQPLAEAKQIRLWLTIDQDAPVLADIVYLRDALENLLSRCIRNSGRSAEINLKIATEAEKVQIKICDQSRFDDQSVENAFEPFPPGLQIGPAEPGNLDLALSQRIIRAFGGEVELRPSTNGTNCFVITLPRQTS